MAPRRATPGLTKQRALLMASRQQWLNCSIAADTHSAVDELTGKNPRCAWFADNAWVDRKLLGDRAIELPACEGDQCRLL